MKRSNWEELRDKYPNILFPVWVNWVREIGSPKNLDDEGWEIFKLILVDEEKEGRERETAKDRERKKMHDRIVGALPHRQLDISVPDQLDQEHAQAILVYGFVPPTKKRSFVGSRGIETRTVRQFVQNKLGVWFNLNDFEQALRWLIRNGVISDDKGLALNLGSKKCTPQGKEMLQKISLFHRKA